MWLPRRLWRKVFLVWFATFLLLFVFCQRKLFLNPLNKYDREESEQDIPGDADDQYLRSFSIDFDADTFRMDGKPFRFVSGSFHYFRAPRSKWRGIMRSMRAAGLNALSTYIEWSSHEVLPGQFNYKGWRDFNHFLHLASEEELYVLLRPGPFICGERDFGGLPAWLLKMERDILLRRNHPAYQRHVTRWFRELFRKLQKHLYGNGGPIILIQVENEYGSDAGCDPSHAVWLRDLIRSYVGDKAVLYSTDGAFSDYMRCTVDGVYPTVDFTVFQETNASFDAQRGRAPRGPLVNSEFYTGWLTHWGDSFMEVVPTDLVLQSLDEMLSLGASVNMYMFHGGTNFGFTSGANVDAEGRYAPCLTSYDYDSPLNEAGDPTEKYFAIRELLGKYFNLGHLPLPEVTPKGNYGMVHLEPKISIFDLKSKIDSVFSEYPLSFEQLSLKDGFLLYETIIPAMPCQTCLLQVSKLHDRADVFLDETSVACVYRGGRKNASLVVHEGQTLSLLVENLGRVNQGDIYDLKGILSNVTLGGKILNDWTMYRFPLDNIPTITSFKSNVTKVPLFCGGTFEIRSKLLDTFLDMRTWSKGVVFINRHNLGRYWSEVGPQYTLFVPADYLLLGTNSIIIFEQNKVPEDWTANFVTNPIFNLPFDKSVKRN